MAPQLDTRGVVTRFVITGGVTFGLSGGRSGRGRGAHGTLGSRVHGNKDDGPFCSVIGGGSTGATQPRPARGAAARLLAEEGTTAAPSVDLSTTVGFLDSTALRASSSVPQKRARTGREWRGPQSQVRNPDGCEKSSRYTRLRQWPSEPLRHRRGRAVRGGTGGTAARRARVTPHIRC